MKWKLTACLIFWISGVTISQAQGLLAVSPDATFVAYQCAFDRDTNTSVVSASLVGADGLPIPRDAYTVSVSAAGTAIAPGAVETANVGVRPPLEMIVVLDITNTMEIESVVNAVADELFPQLQVEDRVALITFAEDVSPRTRFYTDKNRLLNEHMIDLLPGLGDNRLYDAIFEAVTEFPINQQTRQVVLALTDSNRRDIEQTELGDIITRAQRETIQIYSVGIRTLEDQPDVAELEQLGEATGGYTWVYDADRITRAGIKAGVASALDALVDTLDSEVTVRIGLDGQTPDENGFITYEIAVATRNDATLTDSIACPVEELSHSIAFDNDVADGAIIGPVDVAVDFASDLPDDQTAVIFLVDGDIVQEGAGSVYRFNDPPLQPGYYAIGAQLRSRFSGEVLATTPRALELYVQPAVELGIDGGYFGAVEGEVRFEVRAEDPSFELPPVEFTVAPAVAPTNRRPLSDSPIPFNQGVAILVIEDIAGRLAVLFPEVTEERFIVEAVVPGVAGDAPTATSLFEVIVPRPPEPGPTVRVPRPIFDWNAIFWALLTVLVLINVLLFRSVARARVRYLINHPDNSEMGAQLMNITVRREGVKQAHTLTKRTITVGRGSTNDINLGDDPNISRNHGVVMWRRGAWYYTNRKRRATSHINGKRRIGFIWRRLVPVTEIEIGNALLVFHSSAQQDVSEFVKTNF